MRTIQHRAVGVIAAATATIGPAACGSASAPSISAPSPASSSAPPASSSSTPPSPSSDSSSPSSPSSPSSASPAPSAAGSVCTTTSSYGPVFPDKISAKTFGTSGQATSGSAYQPSTVQVVAQKPRVLPAPSNSFELGPGMQYVGIDVRTHLASGTSFFMAGIDFNLFDAKKNTCSRQSFTTVISGDKLLRTTTMNATTKDANGTLVFEVPLGTDMNSLTLAFGADVNYTPVLAWKG